MKNKIKIIRMEENQGVGGAIAAGYIWCLENEIDAAVVMAGDGQMDPNDLHYLLSPVVLEGVNYSKGNRLLHPDARRSIPKIRLFGNSVLSLLTKFASGYWHIADSQCGYCYRPSGSFYYRLAQNVQKIRAAQRFVDYSQHTQFFRQRYNDQARIRCWRGQWN